MTKVRVFVFIILLYNIDMSLETISNREEVNFQRLSQGLDELLKNLNEISLGEDDYKMLSARFSDEIDSYFRDNLIKSLIDARSRVGEMPDTDASTDAMTEKRIIKSGMQKAIIFSHPVQEVFDCLKQVPFLSPTYYETIVQNHRGIVESLTDFINKLEEGRKRKRLGK
jgi:hypothetical protein